MLSDVVFAVFHYPVVVVCSEYHARVRLWDTPAGTPANLDRTWFLTSASTLQVCQGTRYPRLPAAIQAV